VTAESVEKFRSRARAWLAQNMPRLDSDDAMILERDALTSWQRARELQKRLYDGGFAGICFPREYGGLGLGYEYKKAFDAEALAYETPLLLNVPSFAICCATILDMGSEEQKRTHVPAALRGDEVLVQLLSEPGGGSDLAGVITRADRRDGRWIINGAKTWSTWAFAADYGLCLARTDWEAPKHNGLTMFLVPLRHAGVTINRIRQVNGSVEFCEEFFDDVELGDDAVVGEPGKGWEVASRQLYHERRTMGDGSEYTSGPGIAEAEDVSIDLMSLVDRTNQGASERVREMVGRALVHARCTDNSASTSSTPWPADPCRPPPDRSSGWTWPRPTTSRPTPPTRSPVRRPWSRMRRGCSTSALGMWAARSPASGAAPQRWRAT